VAQPGRDVTALLAAKSWTGVTYGVVLPLPLGCVRIYCCCISVVQWLQAMARNLSQIGSSSSPSVRAERPPS